MPRSASVCGIQPCAWRRDRRVRAVAQPRDREAAGADARERPVVEHAAGLAPVLPARGRGARTTRPAPSLGRDVRLAGQLVDAVADRRASLKATEVNATSGTSAGHDHAPRCRSGGASRRTAARGLARRSRPRPTSSSSTTISSTSSPNSPATLSFARQRLEALRERVLRQRPGADGAGRRRAAAAAPAGCAAAAARAANHATAPQRGGRGGAARLGEQDRQDERRPWPG